MPYPTSIDNFTDPGPNDPRTAPSHAGLHVSINDAVEALETKLGTGADTPDANKILVGLTPGVSQWKTFTPVEVAVADVSNIITQFNLLRAGLIADGLVVPPAFSPADLSGLTWWGDYASLVNPGNGNPMPTWPAVAGHGLPALTAIVGERPLYIQGAGPNGHPFVRFDGVDDGYRFGVASDFVGAVGDATFVLVARITADTQANDIIQTVSGTYYPLAFAPVVLGGPKLLSRAMNSGIDGFNVHALYNTWQIWIARILNGVCSVWVNGVKGTDSVVGTPDFSGTDPLYLSVASEGGWQGYGFNGDVIEGIVYNVAHSDSDIETKLSAYASARYSI